MFITFKYVKYVCVFNLFGIDRDTQRSSICWFPTQMPTRARTGPDGARRLGVDLDLLCGWCLSKCISRESWIPLGVAETGAWHSDTECRCLRGPRWLHLNICINCIFPGTCRSAPINAGTKTRLWRGLISPWEGPTRSLWDGLYRHSGITECRALGTWPQPWAEQRGLGAGKLSCSLFATPIACPTITSGLAGKCSTKDFS